MELEDRSDVSLVDLELPLEDLAGPRDVFLSIQPEYANRIVEGLKTVEFRRKFISAERAKGARIWIYSSSPEKEVVASAEVQEVVLCSVSKLWSKYRVFGGIDRRRFLEYFSGVSTGHALILQNVAPMATKVSCEQLTERGFHIPQSYRYVTEDVQPLLKEAQREAATRYKRSHCA